MNKRSIIFWVLYAGILIFLYILSATELIIKENETKVYSISILIDGISGENYENMKKGMDEAAYEYNVDMRFPPIAENLSLEDKVEIAKDEIEAGSKALIVGNRWKGEVESEIKKKYPELPIITLGDEGDISLDYPDIVKLLSGNIRVAESVENEVCIVLENLKNGDEAKLNEELTEKLEMLGYKVKTAEGAGPKLEKQLDAFNRNKTIFVSLDKDSSSRVVKYVIDNGFSTNNTKIYTVGATDYLLGKLEDGEITGIIGWNEYDMGYLIVEKLMKKIKNKKENNKDVIEAFFVTGNDLKNEKYIKILYPISG